MSSSIKSLKSQINNLLSAYGRLQQVHNNEIFDELRKVTTNKYLGNVITFKECDIKCPDGFTKLESEDTCECISNWSADCGQDCAFKKCSDGDLEWVVKDFTKNPYTCVSKDIPKSSNYFIEADGSAHELPKNTACKKKPLTSMKYAKGFLKNNMMTLGKPYSSSTPCKFDLPKTTYSSDIEKLQKELLNVATKIQNKITDLQNRKKKVMKQSKGDEDKIDRDLQEYTSMLQEFKEFSKKNPSIQVIKMDTNDRVESEYMMYLLYLLLVVVTLLFVFYHLQK
jgi:hypothetical protein